MTAVGAAVSGVVPKEVFQALSENDEQAEAEFNSFEALRMSERRNGSADL